MLLTKVFPHVSAVRPRLLYKSLLSRHLSRWVFCCCCCCCRFILFSELQTLNLVCEPELTPASVPPQSKRQARWLADATWHAAVALARGRGHRTTPGPALCSPRGVRPALWQKEEAAGTERGVRSLTNTPVLLSPLDTHHRVREPKPLSPPHVPPCGSLIG